MITWRHNSAPEPSGFLQPRLAVFFAVILGLGFFLDGCRPGVAPGRGKKTSDSEGLQDAVFPSVQEVEAALRGKNIYLKGQGAWLAARYGYRFLLPILRANALDPHWYVRYHSLAALHQLSDREAIPIFISGLKDDDNSVRFKALEGLADLGDDTVVPEVIGRLTDGDAYVRAAAAYALGELKAPQAIAALIDRLSSDDRPVVGREAYLALLKITGEKFPARPESWETWWRQRAGERQIPRK